MHTFSADFVGKGVILYETWGSKFFIESSNVFIGGFILAPGLSQDKCKDKQNTYGNISVHYTSKCFVSLSSGCSIASGSAAGDSEFATIWDSPIKCLLNDSNSVYIYT